MEPHIDVAQTRKRFISLIYNPLEGGDPSDLSLHHPYSAAFVSLVQGGSHQTFRKGKRGLRGHVPLF